MEIILTEKQYLERSDYWKAFRKMCGAAFLELILCMVLLQLLKTTSSILGVWHDIIKVFAWGVGAFSMIYLFFSSSMAIWGVRRMQRQYNEYIDLEKEMKASFGEEGASVDLKESGRHFTVLYKDMFIVELDKVIVMSVPLVISRERKEGKKLLEYCMQQNISRGCRKLLSK